MVKCKLSIQRERERGREIDPSHNIDLCQWKKTRHEGNNPGLKQRAYLRVAVAGFNNEE